MKFLNDKYKIIVIPALFTPACLYGRVYGPCPFEPNR